MNANLTNGHKRGNLEWRIKKSNTLKKSILSSLLIILLFGSVLPNQLTYSVSYNFGSQNNLSNTAASTSTVPRVAVSGSNVYAVWVDATTGSGDIYFSRSTDSGATFNGGTAGSPGAAVLVHSTTASSSTVPQIAVSGSNVYVVWKDATTGSGDIYFSRSTDSGATFNGGTAGSPGAAVNLSSLISGTSDNPVITASGSNVYVAWRDTATGSGDIYFSRSTDSGATFNGGTAGSPGAAVLVHSTTASSSTVPQIEVSGSNVYVTWQDATTGAGDIYFSRSTDSGATFNGGTAGSPGAADNLSGNAAASQTPQITASGSNVYVAWRDLTTGSGDIYFSRSTDSGATFNGGTAGSPGAAVLVHSTTASSSTVPQIEVSGSNVYVTWQDATTGAGDIYFSRSTDSGATFNGGTAGSPGAAVNLSVSNSGASITPQIAASGVNVFVVWRDATPGNNEIFFSASDDDGATFNGGTAGSPGNPSNISNTSGSSTTPQLAASGAVVYPIWDDALSGTVGEVILVRGTSSSISVSLNQAQYKLSDTATVTVTAPGSNLNSDAVETISATVTSTTDSTGITLTLTETGASTGIFSKQFTFTINTSSGSILKVAPGNTITATFSSQTGTATIFSRTVEFDFATYTLSAPAIITVTDQNSNLDTGAAETISVVVTSTTDSTGITLTLTETGSNTGVFTHTQLIYMTDDDIFSLNDVVTISQQETASGQNTNGIIDTLSVTVTSTTDSTGITLVLTETNANTGSFNGKLKFTSDASSGNFISVQNGDRIGITYLGETTRGLITPNPNAGVGAIKAAIGDTVTASYQGTSDTATIVLGSGGGGGGGGLLRPGMVLDALGSIISDIFPPLISFDDSLVTNLSLSDDVKQSILETDPLKPKMPLINPEFDLPLQINNMGFALSPYANTIKTVSATTEKPINLKLIIYESANLEHIDLATNIRGLQREIYNSDTHIVYNNGNPLEIIDPHDFFSDVKFEISKNDKKNIITYEITFAKPMEKSDLITRVWDEKRNAMDIKIFDALEIKQYAEQIETGEAQVDVEHKSDEPTAISIEKSQHTENKLNKDIVLEWSGYSGNSISDQQFLDSVNIEASYIPKWFKETARLVYHGDISTEEFENALMYLYKHGVIK